jgi:hypothetical protein
MNAEFNVALMVWSMIKADAILINPLISGLFMRKEFASWSEKMKHATEAVRPRSISVDNPCNNNFPKPFESSFVLRLAVNLIIPWLIPGSTNIINNKGMTVEMVYSPYCSEPSIRAIMITDNPKMMVDIILPMVR